MRNFIVHAYQFVDEDVLWDTIERDLGPLKSELVEMLADTVAAIRGSWSFAIPRPRLLPIGPTDLAGVPVIRRPMCSSFSISCR